MRVESSITAITWVPFAALDRMRDLPFGLAVAHYDVPPPALLGDLEELRRADRFREANELHAWIEVERGEIVAFGHSGRGLAAGKDPGLGAPQVAFPAIEYPVIQPEPRVERGAATFSQTVGGRIGLPAPRALAGKAYFRIGSATAWTTLQLVLRADGTSEGRLVAASPFPVHSVYGPDRRLAWEHGGLDASALHAEALDEHPWAGEDPLEAELDAIALRGGARLSRRRLAQGETLVEQGEPGVDMFLLVEGVLDVEVDGETIAQVGAGAVIGELALLGDGLRTATLRAARPSRVAVLDGRHLAGSQLPELARAART